MVRLNEAFNGSDADHVFCSCECDVWYDQATQKPSRIVDEDIASDTGITEEVHSPSCIGCSRCSNSRKRKRVHYDDLDDSTLFRNVKWISAEDLQEDDELGTSTHAPKKHKGNIKIIISKPTETFPEDPEPNREGVAPHKSQNKGKDIPPDARWTKVDRRLINPEALEEAKERFEERTDCVIVLRVLSHQEIQALADRTKEIRERRGI